MSTELSDDVLLNIALEAFPHERCAGVLLYGSRAQGCVHAESDIDLVYVIENTRRYRYVRRIRNMDMDVYAASAGFFARTMEKDKRNNDNFLLHAFATGRELSAGNDVLQRLVRKAQLIWRRGPLPASSSEKESLALAAAKACLSVRRWISKAGLCPESRELAILECGSSLDRMLHGYCRAHGLWALAPAEMLRSDDPRYAEINALLRAYLRAAHFEEKIAVFEEISKAISRSCDHNQSSSYPAIVPSHEAGLLDG